MSGSARTWLLTAVAEFGRESQRKLSGGGSPEASIRGPLEGLLRTVGEHHQQPEISWHDEYPVAELGVRLDYVVRAAGELTGYIELKRPGLSIDPSTFRGANKKQWERLRDLPNLLYTNGTDWRLYRHGHPVAEATFTGGLAVMGGKLAPSDPDAFDALLKQFLLWRPIAITNVARLVQQVAPLCRLLRGSVLEQLSAEAKSSAPPQDFRVRPFTGLRNDWRQLLFPTADETTFADGYAQTVAFALLLARAEGLLQEDSTLHDVSRRLDAGHALMGRALDLLTGHVGERFAVSLELLKRTVARVDWSAIEYGNKDAYLHLYEHFLDVYDPGLRQRSGSYYTPREVVTEMVRLTEDILISRLGHAEGLGSDEVRIVDPAMGTGTFLHAAIERVAARAEERQGCAMRPDAVARFVGRLHGLELQMGPYAVAELRTTVLLKRYGVHVPADGPHLYVTDTLDNPHTETDYLPSTYDPISDSRRRANQLKAKVPVTVVIGNPPYDDKAENRGGWVEKREARDDVPLLEDFRLAGNGRYEHVLKNMYVYFWRWATWKVFDAHPEDQHGVVCFITPSGWATGPGGRGMRDYIRRTCDEGWIISLSPEGQRADVGTRVFPGVAQPLAICVVVRRAGAMRGPEHRATLHYRSLSGRRAEKFSQLRQVRLDDDGWRPVHSGATKPFTPRTESGWDDYPALGDLFPWGSPGVKSNRAWVSAPSPETLRRRWRRLFAETDPEQRSVLFKETRDRALSHFAGTSATGNDQVTTSSGAEEPEVVRYAQRSFDRQWLIRDFRAVDFPRPDLWSALSREQLFLNQQSSQAIESGPAVVATHLIPDTHHFNGRGGRVMPLYHPDGSANVPHGLLTCLARALELGRVPVADLAAYVVAITGHRGFTDRFREDLLTPGVRVPLTRDPELWHRAVGIGREVLWTSTYGERFADTEAGRPRGSVEFVHGDHRQVRYDVHIGTAVPEHVYHDLGTATLHIGEGTLAPVTDEMWNYDVGGMPIVRKWFGYRKASPSSKRSSPLDDLHVESWPGQWTIELIELLSVLRRLTELVPHQQELLTDVLAGPVISRGDLASAAVLPPGKAATRARAPSSETLFTAETEGA
ncbi:type ISP restriction/modification enzyme [Streptomyces profundus]|uniref:type ISP restriction/modification enzyme n=1 Tax=Streptomyces profundus TaxID=2867410 RepID=UPI001D16D8DD|nr:type ISP restriction/modification enzyme [Streptomyces sp. MA3_2.13]UED85068.1 N-6 DNA methylase [Streptomyces sp. MA3_2.13]